MNFGLARWKSKSVVNRTLSSALIIAILGTIGTLVYVIAAPQVDATFTEFYILGHEGKAAGYDDELVTGEEAKVLVGIINQEQETVSYRVEVNIDGVKHNETDMVVIDQGKSWEREVGFVPVRVGDNQKVEFLLYKQGQSEAYQSLHLWVNVKEKA